LEKEREMERGGQIVLLARGNCSHSSHMASRVFLSKTINKYTSVISSVKFS
jgi:hypothetical protein